MIKQKHQQLYEILAEELRQGNWEYKEKLPNLKDLAGTYSVSINVASKAIDMLKKDGLVKVKVGDGIYSNVSKVERSMEFRHSGDRLFGSYRSAKCLKVLVEDNSDWQMLFWNDLFDMIVKECPDIELQISYHATKQESDCDFDIILGSRNYISQSGLPPEKLMTSAVLKDFYPDLYDGLSLSPEDLTWRGEEHYLPYGFVCNQLLCHSEVPEAKSDENILNYIERLADTIHAPVAYGCNPGRNFLYNCGLHFVDFSTGKLAMPGRKDVLSIFRRIRELYKGGHLIWLHGVILDNAEMYPLKLNQPFRMTDYPFNLSAPGERKLHSGQDLKFMRMPSKESITYTELAMGINKDNRFPEESLRILRRLLSSEVQSEMFSNNVAFPLHSKLLSGTDFSYLNEDIPKCRRVSTNTPDIEVNNVLSYIVDWEFYYYLTGVRNDDVFDFMRNKIKYYLKS